jgi:signal transduction histidine kinase
VTEVRTLSERKNTGRPRSARERVVREIIGRAISHDLRSPVMHFQDDLADALERQDKRQAGDVDGHLGLMERQEAFNDSVERAYDEFRRVADEVRALYTPFHLIYPILKGRIRRTVLNLVDEMQALISEADRQKLLAADPKLRRDLGRFCLNVERLYFALETIAYLDDDLDQEQVNLAVTLRKLYLAAAPREMHFNFGHLPNNYLSGPTWKSSVATVSAIRHQIISALQNVLLNALRYAAPSPNREVFYWAETADFASVTAPYGDRIKRYHPPGDWTLFHILNSGARIAEQNEDELFGYGTTFGSHSHERFGGGSGVGLAIAKLMITDNGGLIFYNPFNQNHTDFCIALPVRHEDRIPEVDLFTSEYPR